MSKNEVKKRFVDIVQWVMIVGLLIACIFIWRMRNKLVDSREFKDGVTYTKIYDSQSIDALKKENEALYDSIKKLKDVEQVIEAKYKAKYESGIVKASKDSVRIVYVETPDTTFRDSVYSYTSKSDTVSYKLDIAAKDVRWHRLYFLLNDKFTIVTKENDGRVETNIKTEMGDVVSPTLWHRKNRTWKDRISIGPQVGVGYDVWNRNVGLYVGVGVSFDLW